MIYTKSVSILGRDRARFSRFFGPDRKKRIPVRPSDRVFRMELAELTNQCESSKGAHQKLSENVRKISLIVVTVRYGNYF